eukprot:jgi/Chlat1/4775/Chrsp308S04747
MVAMGVGMGGGGPDGSGNPLSFLGMTKHAAAAGQALSFRASMEPAAAQLQRRVTSGVRRLVNSLEQEMQVWAVSVPASTAATSAPMAVQDALRRMSGYQAGARSSGPSRPLPSPPTPSPPSSASSLMRRSRSTGDVRGAVRGLVLSAREAHQRLAERPDPQELEPDEHVLGWGRGFGSGPPAPSAASAADAVLGCTSLLPPPSSPRPLRLRLPAAAVPGVASLLNSTSTQQPSPPPALDIVSYIRKRVEEEDGVAQLWVQLWGGRKARSLPTSPQRSNGERQEEEDYDDEDDWFARFVPGRRQQLRKERKRFARTIRDPSASVAIVTTASLPWMTGTAVNPVLRAAHLAQTHGNVTLVVPWLSSEDQAAIFPNGMTFQSPQEQEDFVKHWLRQRLALDQKAVAAVDKLKLRFYPGKYAKEKGSILPIGDITECIPRSISDVAVLEEPEHLTWYHHGTRWTDRFDHVVGILHTNYLEYVRREPHGKLRAFLLRHVNRWVCRVHCNQVIRLSAATQADIARSMVKNVHGVCPAFINVGVQRAADRQFPNGAYFIGKVLWSKGYKELMEMLPEEMQVDCFGHGPDFEAVQDAAKAKQLKLQFHGPRDHADPTLHNYKIFVNPSISDVLCTTTAEALAMGKWAVVADHPSNAFFASTFPNCLTFKTPEEFKTKMEFAMSTLPAPLTPEQQHALSWEAATERFLDAAASQPRPALRPKRDEKIDAVLALAHWIFAGNGLVRKAGGALPNTLHCRPEDAPLLAQDSRRVRRRRRQFQPLRQVVTSY